MSAKSVEPASPSTSLARANRTDIATIDSQLAAEANSIKTLINQSGGPKIVIDRSGHFTGPDGVDLGTSLRLVVVDFILKNQYYTTRYDPANPVPPVCFAMSSVEDSPEMAPDPTSPEPQHATCKGCPQNEFGTALGGTGKGKACKNTYELAVLLEEEFDEPEPKLYLMSVPPTAMRSFAGFANLCARVLDSGPIKAIATVRVVPQGSYNTMAFGEPDNNDRYAEHIALREEAHTMLMRAPDLSNYKPSQPARRPTR